MSTNKRKTDASSSTSSSSASKKPHTRGRPEDAKAESQSDEKGTDASSELLDVFKNALSASNVEVSLDNLKPMKLRALRESGVKALMARIASDGWKGGVAPIYVQAIPSSEDYAILEGNHRIEALKRLRSQGKSSIATITVSVVKPSIGKMQLSMMSNGTCNCVYSVRPRSKGIREPVWQTETDIFVSRKLPVDLPRYPEILEGD